MHQVLLRRNDPNPSHPNMPQFLYAGALRRLMPLDMPHTNHNHQTFVDFVFFHQTCSSEATLHTSYLHGRLLRHKQSRDLGLGYPLSERFRGLLSKFEPGKSKEATV